MLTLWDLIEPVLKLRGKSRRARPTSGEAPERVPARPGAGGVPERVSVPLSPRGPTSTGASHGAGGSRGVSAAARKPKEPAQARYDRIVQTLLREHNLRVRKWRSSMSGIAWYVTYRDGTISRLIESPRPKGPMSMAIFLHEVGHHAIGFNRYKPRCLEEYHAWKWAIEQMEAQGLNITGAVRHRMALSLWYAVDKARRRGLKEVPAELGPFLTRPVRGKRG